MARILVADPIDSSGIQRLSESGHIVDVLTGKSEAELSSVIAGYDAMIVRSETKVTAKLIGWATKLQVIGRAGVGVDNIDIDAATSSGIAVVNAPTGNTVAAAEHAFALMMSLARNIPQADASVRRGEWSRSKFTGVELRNKTLGVVGLGKVGSEVARRALAFQMNVLAFDPFVAQDHAKSMGVDVVPMETLLRNSDFISIHTPLTASTKSLIGQAEFKKLKDGVRIINAARGGLVDEELLDKALQSGKVAGAALDVFKEEPIKQLTLTGNDKAVLTPHLGASTEEAQIEVAIEVVDQVLEVLGGGSARYTINTPFLPAEVRDALSPYVPVAATLGKIAIQLAEGQLDSVVVGVAGEIAGHDASIVGAAALTGILGASTDMRINLVNAPVLARERGIRVAEEKNPEGAGQYLNTVSVEVRATESSVKLSGTSANGHVHLVQINDFYLDMEASAPYMLFTSHSDRPGMIGKIGTLAGEHDINISFMEVGRDAPRGSATMVVGFDDPVSDALMEAISSTPGMSKIKLVTLDLAGPMQPRLRAQ